MASVYKGVSGTHECCYVATFEIPGLYLHTEIDEEVIMFLVEELAELVLKVSPKIYRKYVIINSKGKPL